jgi:hypothetical protein
VAALTYAVFELSGSNNLYPGNLISFTRITAMHSRQVCPNLSLCFLEAVRWSFSVYSVNLILYVIGMMKLVISLFLYNLRVYCNIKEEFQCICNGNPALLIFFINLSWNVDISVTSFVATSKLNSLVLLLAKTNEQVHLACVWILQ